MIEHSTNLKFCHGCDVVFTGDVDVCPRCGGVIIVPLCTFIPLKAERETMMDCMGKSASKVGAGR
jgi:rRNA maturation endonuclease Nob1